MKKLKYTALPYAVYALIFILAPIIIMVLYSFQALDGGFTFDHFLQFFNFSDPIYLKVLWRSIKLAAISTVICFIIGYPMAFILSRVKTSIRDMIAFLFILPMWMNFLLRTYAWMTILERTGLLNTLLNYLGLPEVNIIYTQWAVILGNVYNFLPFMILPIYNVLIKIDRSVIEAAQDLGGSSFTVFRRVIFPLSLPGVLSGVSMTFMPAVTTFTISRLLGGSGNALIGDLIENQFKYANNWGFGSAMSVVLMILILAAMNIMRKYEGENSGGSVLM